MNFFIAIMLAQFIGYAAIVLGIWKKDFRVFNRQKELTDEKNPSTVETTSN